MNPASGDEFEAELQQLRALLTRNEPSSIQPGIVIPRQGVTYLSGTTLPWCQCLRSWEASARLWHGGNLRDDYVCCGWLGPGWKHHLP